MARKRKPASPPGPSPAEVLAESLRNGVNITTRYVLGNIDPFTLNAHLPGPVTPEQLEAISRQQSETVRHLADAPRRRRRHADGRNAWYRARAADGLTAGQIYKLQNNGGGGWRNAWTPLGSARAIRRILKSN